MPPNNTPQQAPPPVNAPNPPVQAPPQPAPIAAQPVATIDTTKTNQAGAVFLVMLIVGFTFHLPLLLALPIVFFCIAAGIIFFKDVFDARSKQLPPPPAGYPAASVSVIKPKRSLLKTFLLVVFGVIGSLIALYVAFIAFIMIMFASSGV